MIPYEGLSQVDLELPVIDNSKVLSKGKKNPGHIYLGLSSGNDPSLKEGLTGRKISDKELLSVYAQHFNVVELNATHYRIYEEKTVKNWAAQVVDNPDFRFCPKFYNGITHRGGLLNKEELTTSFISSIHAFADHLGPSFIQLSDKFTPTKRGELMKYLNSLPKEQTYFIELRHAEWFPLQEKFKNLLNELYLLNIGIVITDTPGRRDIVNTPLTTPKAFIRFVCAGGHDLDYYRIDNWRQTLKLWKEQGLEECYFFLHIHQENQVVPFTKYVQSQLTEMF